MKKLFLGVSVFIALVVIGCSADQNSDVQVSSINQKSVNNMFEKVIDEQLTSINLFTPAIANIGVNQIDFTSISQDNIVFTVNSVEGFSINAVDYTLNGQQFKIGTTTDGYLISSLSSDVQVEYHSATGVYYYYSPSTGQLTEDLLEGNGITEDTQNFRQYAINKLLLAEMVTPGAEFTKAPISTVDSNPTARGGDQGDLAFVAAGFHLNKADADAECRTGFLTLRATHKGVYSHGYTVSCIWDGTACWCTSTWYYGSCGSCPSNPSYPM